MTLEKTELMAWSDYEKTVKVHVKLVGLKVPTQREQDDATQISGANNRRDYANDSSANLFNTHPAQREYMRLKFTQRTKFWLFLSCR